MGKEVERLDREGRKSHGRQRDEGDRAKDRLKRSEIVYSIVAVAGYVSERV